MNNRLRRARYIALLEKIRERYPKTRLIYKYDHWLWKRMPAFLRDSGTTLGNTIYMPRNDDVQTLGHEYQHIVDHNEMPRGGFEVMYTMPQTTSITLLVFMLISFGLGFIWPGILLACLALLALAPWPSPKRAYLEMRAYCVSMYVGTLSGLNLYAYKSSILSILTGWVYYKMIWRTKTAEKVFDKHTKVFAYDGKDTEEAIRNGLLIPTESIVYKDIYDVFKTVV
jgi:hypothetical protein